MLKYRDLKSEKEVEHFWWEFMKEYFPNCVVQAREIGKNTDGFLIDESNDIYTLIEVKEDLELKTPSEQAKVLIQSIFYIKQQDIAGKKLPKTVFIADKNEAFIIHTNSLTKYLDYDVDWNTAPSQAHKIFQEMLIDITDDEKINPFVFSIKDGFVFDAIKNKLIDLNQNVKRLIKITDDNIQPVFEDFVKTVLSKNKLTVNEQVNLFIDLLINPEGNYLHPKKKNTIHSKTLGYIKVKEQNFISFFEHYDGEQYTVCEKEKMVSIIDRLIEDESRKRNGEFFTPTIWVDEAHKMISEQFGSDWKEKYIVWDCAWGTGNLTRDYKFENLYCSTLQYSDIKTAEQMNINPEATKFQFDFLNDDLELLKEPDYAPELYKALQDGKEILFLINPPYGTATNLDNLASGTSNKKGVAKTKINDLMLKDKMGKSASQLYAQFLYRITKINETNNNIKIGLFSPPLFISGNTFSDFRKLFFNNFSLIYGMLFDASHFADVSSWGLSFTIFNNDKNKTNAFFLDVKELDDTFINVVEKSKKQIYNVDDELPVSKWIREEIKNRNDVEILPHMSSALTISSKENQKLIKGSLGGFCNLSNNVVENVSGVYLVSSIPTRGNAKIALSILPENFEKICATFTARKTIKSNWITQKDEYIAPREEVLSSLEYKQWNNDAIVYSLFNTSSNQSSMRQIEYKDKLWDIKNEFFWMSKDDMMELANEHYFDELYQDARASDERYVYNLLQETDLSPDAQELLTLSKELIIKSFKMRKLMNDEHPEYHLNTWDAGWYQMKKVLNKYYKEDYKIFVKKYKAFENRMSPYVYKFGFLK